MIWRGNHNRHSTVAAFADFGEDRDFAEERNVLPRSFLLAAAVAENFHALAVRRGEVAHVFHDAEDRHVHFAEHRDAFAHDAERRFLRRADDDAAIKRHGLAERKLRVARARRQIHEQKIQFAPFDGEEKLLDGFRDHRPAPDHRLVVRDQQPDAHHFHAVIGRRHEALGLVDGRFFVNAHHQRNARPVNVAIQQTDFRAEMRERAGEIRRASRFANATLAAGDGDDSFYAGNFILIRKRTGGRGTGGRLAHFDVNLFHAGQRGDDTLAFDFNLRGGFGIGRGQLHDHADRAVRGRNFFDEAERDDVARIAGILDGLERVLDFFR